MNTHIQYAKGDGSDANGGGSWDTPKRTIGAAIGALPGNSNGTVYVGPGLYPETVTITRPGLRIFGAGPDVSGAHGTLIKAPSTTSHCVALSASNVILKGFMTQGSGTTWTGTGLRVNAGYYSQVTNVTHQNPNNSATATTGGVGLHITNTEGAIFTGYIVQQANTGILLGPEATENTFTGTQSLANWVDLTSNGAGGGNLFLRFKATESVNDGTSPVVNLPAGGSFDNTFIEFDAEESQHAPTTGIIGSDQNTFINFGDSPETDWTVSGNYNQFLGSTRILRSMTITGRSTYIAFLWLYGHYFADKGIGTVVDRKQILAGTYT